MNHLSIKEKLILALYNGSSGDFLTYKPQTFLYKLFPEQNEATIRATVSLLWESGWVEKMEKTGGTFVSPTKTGISQVLGDYIYGIIHGADIKDSSDWDNQFHLCIFNVPESRRQRRARIRELLIKHGFRLWEQGVWLCPVLNQNLVTKLVSEKLITYISFVTASKIDFSHNFLKEKDGKSPEEWLINLWNLSKTANIYRRLVIDGEKLDEMNAFDIVRYRNLIDWEEKLLLVLRQDPFFPNRFYKMSDVRENVIGLLLRLSRKQIL